MHKLEISNYAVIEIETCIVVNIILWDGVAEYHPDDGFILVKSDSAMIGGKYSDGEFYPPPEPELPPPTAAEILASQSVLLQQLNQLAAAQKSALTNRIGVINDAIEFEEATPEEISELPIRQAQLTAWKRYAVLLGRVTTQEGWPPNVIWPEQPAEGMDLTVSAARPTQTSI